MTALKDYGKWDKILAELSSSDDDDQKAPQKKNIRQRLEKIIKSKRTNKKDINNTKNKIDDDASKDITKTQQTKKVNNKVKPKSKTSKKVYYDPLKLPRYNIGGLFHDNFSPLSRLIANSIHPGVLCGNLIHFYHISDLWIFVLFYIINTLIFYRILYFSNGLISGFVILFYFHFIKKIFHSFILDLFLSMFHSKIKDSNDNILKQWRLSHFCYTLMVVLLCSMTFHIISENGPKLTFKQYLGAISFIFKNDVINNKIDEMILNKDERGIYYNLYWMVLLTNTIDITYVGLLIYNFADFKQFNKKNIMLFLMRYLSGMIKPICIELLFGGLIFIIKNDNDPTLFEFIGQIEIYKTLMVMFGLSLAFLFSQWLTRKFQQFNTWIQSFVIKKDDNDKKDK